MKFSETQKTTKHLILILLGGLLLFGAKKLFLDGKIGSQNQIRVLEQNKWIDAPDFALPDLDVHQRSLHDFQGKFVLLNFWATW